MSRIRKALVVVASVVAATAVAAPASAEHDAFKDKHGDLRGGNDIQSVQVKNNWKRIKIRSTHRNLKYGPHAPGGSVASYIDTIRKRKGPEFRLAGPVGFDGDYALVKMRGWRKVVDTPDTGLRCRTSFKVNYKTDAVRMAVRPICLANAFDHTIGKIRVSVSAMQYRKGPGNGHDWAPRRHRFGPAVRRG